MTGALRSLLIAAGLMPAAAMAADLRDLVAAYPEHLAGIEGGDLVWKDGSRMAVSDGEPDKPFADKLKRASLIDQMSLVYPTGPFKAPAAVDADPGRFRHLPFFDKMYGNCSRGEVEKRLVAVTWLPKSGGGTLRVTRVNGVADRLRAVSDQIDAMPAAIRRAAYPSAGTYNCRVVQDTGVRSAHAYGIAIDLNVDVSDYWLWAGGAKGRPFAYRNRIPTEIVAAFERHGFIWGGKWGHFDTMHFEYRPELLPASGS